jgi:hypothetical protein
VSVGDAAPERADAPPRDPELPFLARALDPAEMERRLAAVLAQPGAAPPRLVLELARVVRHKPGRRALVEYAVRTDPPGASRPSFRLLGKCRARGVDSRTFRVARALRAAGLDGRDGVEIPRALGIVPELHMWLQEKVPGETVWEALTGDSGEALSRRIADALHRLHVAPVEPPRRHGIADELHILAERLRSVAELRPAWTARLEGLLDACRRRAAGIPAAEPRGIHRDFHPDQVLVSAGRLALVDLDLYCAGDPALDVGNFRAHLGEWALRLRGDPRAIEGCEGAFEERFLELAGSQRAETVRAWTELSLARHVWISTRFPERRPFTAALLELCEERLDLGKPGKRSAQRAAGERRARPAAAHST